MVELASAMTTASNMLATFVVCMLVLVHTQDVETCMNMHVHECCFMAQVPLYDAGRSPHSRRYKVQPTRPCDVPMVPCNDGIRSTAGSLSTFLGLDVLASDHTP
jgi:hypothetical protein